MTDDLTRFGKLAYLQTLQITIQITKSNNCPHPTPEFISENLLDVLDVDLILDSLDPLLKPLRLAKQRLVGQLQSVDCDYH